MQAEICKAEQELQITRAPNFAIVHIRCVAEVEQKAQATVKTKMKYVFAFNSHIKFHISLALGSLALV
jgi:hypothetical protein